MFGLLVSAVALSALQVRAQTYTATYLPWNAPDHTEQGQQGTNACGNGSSQDSECQNLYINSVEDFCLFAPPVAGANSAIGNTEQIEVAWCMKSGYGTRLIPDGTMQGVHFVQTPDYVQVTGVGDLTKLNIPAGDEGGELDPHGATGNGNPIGGLVFSSAFGQMEQIHEWTNFMSDSQFCFRACKPAPNAPEMCQHIYDVMGCDWNMPANYAPGVFEDCQADSAQPMGVYDGSTFSQGQPSTPAAHPIPSSSQCTPFATISNGAAPSLTPPASSASSSVPASSSVGTSSPISSVPAPSSTVHSSSVSAPSISGSSRVSTLPSGTSSVHSSVNPSSTGSTSGNTQGNSGVSTFASGSTTFGAVAFAAVAIFHMI